MTRDERERVERINRQIASWSLFYWLIEGKGPDIRPKPDPVEGC